MRTTIGFIAFFVTFGLSVSIVGLLFGLPNEIGQYPAVNTGHGCGLNYRIKIRSFLKQDISNGVPRNSIASGIYDGGDESDLYKAKDYRDAVSLYVSKSSSMNDEGMPADFQYAWRKHMAAWEQQAENIRVSQSESPGIDYSDNTGEINETWAQVLRIAQRYSVRIDRSYYQ